MNSPMIVGVSGRAGAGKDTFADFFMENVLDIHKIQFHKYSFAKPIKDAGTAMFGWNDRHAYGDLKEVVDDELGFSPRKFYQLLGTEFGRKMLNEDLWLILAHRFVQEKRCVIIPDVRFENEVQFIKDNNGLLVYIDRETQEVGVSGHASENGISKETLASYHLHIKNNLNVTAFKIKAINFAHEFTEYFNV